MFCADCGNSLQENFMFCPHCGKTLNGKADDSPDMRNNQSMKINSQKSGNPALKGFGIISILVGPMIAVYIGFDAYQSAHRSYAFFWGTRGAARHAENALMDMMPILVLIVAASLLVGIILLVMGRKR